MKYLLAVLLILFASYADIFLFKVGIIPITPSFFLIPLFISVAFLRYSFSDYADLFKSHTFKFFASVLFFSIVYSSISPAPIATRITKISLDAITLFLYFFAVHFFRSENRKLVLFVMLASFITLAGSVWYDYFIGLPKFTEEMKLMVRKGGFGENPNQASSGMKFLALSVLVFVSNNKKLRSIIITLMLVSVFLTFSRSGIVSVILILIFGIANSWKSKLDITPIKLFKSSFKMIILFVILYVGLVMFAGFLKSQLPELARGAMGDRIDLLLGKGEGSAISEDIGSGGGRGDLLFLYIDKIAKNPLGYGTGYTSDQRRVPLNTHNYYLFLAVNYGFLALIFYLIYLRIGFKIAFRRDQFYCLVFLALLCFEGLVTHHTYYMRAILLSLAFFDSLLYKKENVENFKPESS